MTSVFGTDGVRGRVNQGLLTPTGAMAFAHACAAVLPDAGRNTVLIGHDGRGSAAMLESALAAALNAVGVSVTLLGMVSTPAVARLVTHLQARWGVMISASHNPYQDNGFKVMDSAGQKLTEAQEQAIEQHIGAVPSLVSAEHIGQSRRLEEAGVLYGRMLRAYLPEDLCLSPLRLVVDCANGALSHLAPEFLRTLGIEVIPMAHTPDGKNINEQCGAVHPAAAQDAVRAHQADGAILFDGDGDRVNLVDETGALVDGDYILARLALDWQARGQLTGQGIVTTVLANGALVQFLEHHHLRCVRVPVGDRPIAEAMRQQGMNLGGEPSGHLLVGQASMGDGLWAALQILMVLRRAEQPVSSLRRLFAALPTRVCSVPRPVGVDVAALCAEVTQRYEGRLGGGRLVIRPSGTEPVVRILAEGPHLADLDRVMHEVCHALGG